MNSSSFHARWQRRRSRRPAGRRLWLEPLEARLAPSGVQFAPPASIDSHAVPDEAHPADLDGDGDLDILVASPLSSAKVAWYENFNGARSFSRRKVITAYASGPGSVQTADLDGDGDNDVLYASRWGDRIAWHENMDGDGSFSTQHVVSNGVDEALSVHAADFDADGDLDVVSASAGDDIIAWYANTGGAGRFGPPRVVAADAAGVRLVFTADMDGDGDVDIVSVAAGSSTVAWYENTDGAGSFGSPRVIADDVPDARSLHVADVDGDGDLDVLLASYRGPAVVWYENTDGHGIFGPQKVISAEACGAHDLHAGDLDGDGDLDVLSASEGQGVQWYENIDGAGTFAPGQRISSEIDAAVSVDAADMDGDGRLDVLAVVRHGRYVYRSEGAVVWHKNLASVDRVFQPGDANRDGRFDSSDIMQVLQAGKYMSGQPAVWSEGDWNGDGRFDQQDIFVALKSGSWWPPVDDHGDGAEDATLVRAPSVVLGTIEQCGDHDWFQLDARAGKRYVFRVDLHTLRDSVLRLFGPDGSTELIANDDSDWYRASRIEWTAPTSGTYYLRVEQFSDVTTGTYALLVGTGAAWGSDLQLDIPGGLSAYRTRLSENAGTLVATVTRTTSVKHSLKISLTSSDITEVVVPRLVTIPAGATSATFTFQVVDDSVVDGTQYVRLSASAPNHRSGTKGIQVLDGVGAGVGGGVGGGGVRDDHGTSAATSTAIAVPSLTSGNIQVGTDRDWFRINATAGTHYTFETTLVSLGDTKLTLYDTDGVTSLEQNDDGGVGLASKIEWTAPASGTYYLEVVPFSPTQTGTYSLRVSGTSTIPSQTLALEIAQASVSESGETSQVRVTRSGPTSSALLVSLADSPTGQAKVPTSVWIPLGSSVTKFTIDAVNDSLVDGAQMVTITASAAGFTSAADTVWVLDDDDGGGGGGLDDHGNNGATSTAIAVPSLTGGDIKVGTDRDWFWLSATAGTQYTFETTLVSLEDSKLALYDTDGVTLLELNDDGGVGLASKIQWTAPASGTYYLEVMPFIQFQAGTYLLSVS